jgi:hypothetical protein
MSSEMLAPWFTHTKWTFADVKCDNLHDGAIGVGY